LIFFGWYTLAMVILYFVYGMHNSQLQHGEQAIDAPDMTELPGPVVD